jgi:hypothetical protein
MPVMPDPLSGYDDAEVVWSSEFPDGVGVRVATNLWDDEAEGRIDTVPIRVSVTTEDGTGSAYLTLDDAKQLVNLLGNAISKALREQGLA